MELAADVADQLDQAPLDRHVDVLVVLVDLEAVLVELGADIGQAAFDLLEVFRGNDLAAGQHAGMRERLLDVVRRQAIVELDRGVQATEDRVLRLTEPGHGAPQSTDAYAPRISASAVDTRSIWDSVSSQKNGSASDRAAASSATGNCPCS